MELIDVRKMFINYAKKFDLKNKNIMNKFHHSFRVMEFSKDIAKSLNLSDEDVALAMTIGLLHDIARFRQWTEFETYSDSKSFDHGDVGVEILRTMIMEIEPDKEKQNIILKSVQYHNKYKIENLNEKETLFANIIRDADKLDIMIEQANTVESNFILNKDLVANIKNHRLCQNAKMQNYSDVVLRTICFIFDINFQYTFKFLKEKNIILNKINLLESNSNDPQIQEVKNIVLQYLEKECI